MADYAAGKSIEELMNMSQEEFEGLSKKDLRAVVQKLASAANKRLARFEKRGVNTPATVSAEKSGGKFSTKGKGIAALRGEFSRTKNFLQADTSTAKGYEDFVKRNMDALSSYGVDIERKNFEDFWKAFNRLKEIDPSIEQASFRYSVLQALADEFDGADNVDVDDIVEHLKSEITNIYEDQEKLDQQKFEEFNGLVESEGVDGVEIGADEDGDNQVLYPDMY